LRDLGISLDHTALNFDGAAHCVHYAGEIGQQTIVGWS
jgi:hypothetical protein